MAIQKLTGIVAPSSTKPKKLLFANLPKVTPAKAKKLFGGSSDYATKLGQVGAAPNRVIQNDIYNTVTKSRPITQLLKGDKQVIAGNPAYSQFYNYTKAGNLSTQVDLGDQQLREAIIKQAESEGNIPVGTLDKLKEVGTSLLTRVLNAFNLVSGVEKVAGPAYQAVTRPYAEAIIEGVKSGKSIRQVQQEQVLPQLGRTLVAPITFLSEVAQSIWQDLKVVIAGQERDKIYNPYQLLKEDITKLKSALGTRGVENLSEEDKKVLSVIDDTIKMVETDTGNGWMKNIPVIGTALMYPMFKTWGNVIDFAQYMVGEPALYSLNPALPVAKGLFGSSKSLFAFKSTPGIVSRLGRLALNSVENYDDALRLAKALDSPLAENITQQNWENVIEVIVNAELGKAKIDAKTLKAIITYDFPTYGGGLTPGEALNTKRVNRLVELFNADTKQSWATITKELPGAFTGTGPGNVVKLNDYGAMVYKELNEEFADIVKVIDDKLYNPNLPANKRKLTAEEAATILKSDPDIKMAQLIKESPETYLYNRSKWMLPTGQQGVNRQALAKFNDRVTRLSLVEKLMYPTRALTAALLEEGGIVNSIFKRKIKGVTGNVPAAVEEFIGRNFNIDREVEVVKTALFPDTEALLMKLDSIATRNESLKSILYREIRKQVKAGKINLSLDWLTKEKVFPIFWENRNLFKNLIATNKQVKAFIDFVDNDLMNLIKKYQEYNGVVIEHAVRNYWPHVLNVNVKPGTIGFAPAALTREYPTYTSALNEGVEFLYNPTLTWRSEFNLYANTNALNNLFAKAMGVWNNTAHVIFGKPAIITAIRDNTKLMKPILRMTVKDIEKTLNVSLTAQERKLAIDFLNKWGLTSKLKDGLIVFQKAAYNFDPYDIIRVQRQIIGKFPSLKSIFPSTMGLSDDGIYVLLTNYLKDGNTSKRFKGIVNGLGGEQRRFYSLAYAANMSLPSDFNVLGKHYANMKELVEEGGAKAMAELVKNPKLMLDGAAKNLDIITPEIPLVANANNEFENMVKDAVEPTKQLEELTSEVNPKDKGKKILANFRLKVPPSIAKNIKEVYEGRAMRYAKSAYPSGKELARARELSFENFQNTAKKLMAEGALVWDNRGLEMAQHFYDTIGKDNFFDVAFSLEDVINGTVEEKGVLGSSVARKISIFGEKLIDGDGRITDAQTLIHEMWHTLAEDLPQEVYMKIHNAWMNDRNAFIEKFPEMKGYIDEQNHFRRFSIPKLDKEFADLGKTSTLRKYFVLSNDKKTYILNLLDPDIYKLAKIEEWIAETMSRYSLDRLRLMFPDKQVNAVFTYLKLLFERAVNSIKRMFGKQSVEDMLWEGFVNNKFDRTGKRNFWYGAYERGEPPSYVTQYNLKIPVNYSRLSAKNVVSEDIPQAIKDYGFTKKAPAKTAKEIDAVPTKLATGKPKYTENRPLQIYQGLLDHWKQLMTLYNVRLPVTSALGNSFNDAFLLGASGYKNADEVAKIFRLLILSTGAIKPYEMGLVNNLLIKSMRLNTAGIEGTAEYLRLSPLAKKAVNILMDSPNTKASMTTNWLTYGGDVTDVARLALSSGIPEVGANAIIKARNTLRWLERDQLGLGFLNTAGDYAHKISAALRFAEKYPNYEQALDAYNKFFTSFRNLPPFERTLHRRIFMYYLWQRNNFMNYMRAIYNDPQTISRFRMFSEAMSLARDPELTDAIEKLPDGDYRKNLLWVGSPEAYIMGLNTPLESFVNFARMLDVVPTGGSDMTSKFKEAASAFAENLNMPLSMALAYATNYDVRTNRFIDPMANPDVKSTVDGYAKASEQSTSLMLMLPKSVRDYFGFRESINPYTKDVEYFMDPYLNYTISRNPFLVVNTVLPYVDLPEDASPDSERALRDRLIGDLTGFRLRGVRDIFMVNLVSEKALNDKLGKYLVQSGLFNITEVPNLTPSQRAAIGLPMTVESYQQAMEFNASPLNYMEFKAQQEAESKTSTSSMSTGLKKLKKLKKL